MATHFAREDYKASFISIPELPGELRQAMAGIYLAHYDGSDEELFLSDLEDKTEALLVHYGNTLVGFTTHQVYEREWQGHPIRVVFSGDTVVDRAHWGQQALAFSWIGRLGQLIREHPDLPLYWFLIVKGHRTFKYLPTFSKSFYPHWSDMRDDLKPLADTLAEEKFGANYDPNTGVVTFAKSHGHLKPDIAYPKDKELKRKEVQFFLQRNPNYQYGDELVCLCEITEDNLKPLTRRIFLRGAQ